MGHPSGTIDRRYQRKSDSLTGCGKMRDRAGKTYPFDKLRAGSQGLKPDVFSIIYGPTKVVP
jgi:hypothetical protein